jgi:hypothetical protein
MDKLPQLDAISNIMASNGWLIERMVPDASPGEACTGKQGKRMSGHDACSRSFCPHLYPCNMPWEHPQDALGGTILLGTYNSETMNFGMIMSQKRHIV